LDGEGAFFAAVQGRISIVGQQIHVVLWDDQFLSVLPWSAAIILTGLFRNENLDGIVVAVDTLYVLCTSTSEAVPDTAPAPGFGLIDLGRVPIAIEHAAAYRDPVTGKTGDTPRHGCPFPLDHHGMSRLGETVKGCDAALTGARQ
jgi:hypothetical protein